MLLLVFLGAWRLVWMSRNSDPRFYLFLKSPAGRALSRIFRWDPLPKVVETDRPDEALTPDEREMKRRWRAELEAGSDAQPAAQVSYRSLRFRMEFPNLKFYLRSPYVIASDEPLQNIQQIVQTLMEVERGIQAIFGALETRAPEGADIEVLIFADAARFQSYRRQLGQDDEGLVGFYNARRDRLVIFNAASAANDESRKQIAARLEAEYRKELGASAGGVSWIEWREAIAARLQRDDALQTLATVRHEAAHQLLFSTGIHSDFRAERPWLEEGMAAYCETPIPGEVDRLRVRSLALERENGEWIGIAQVVNARDLKTLGKDARAADAAYSQAWALVRMLMETERRSAFFDYIRFIRDPAHVSEVARAPAWELLCRRMRTSEAQMAEDYDEYLEELWR